jgi:glycosyltransferase involved in cell wall biosynthesis
MIDGQRIVVVMPAYNATRTLERTLSEIPRPLVDEVILVDDASADGTAALAERLGVDIVLRHEHNRGYGGNQKTCYRTALERGADIVIMLHPDYQYTPKLIAPMAGIIASGVYPVVLGSRILGNGAIQGGMPLYKYVANRALTFVENLCTSAKLSEYHTGYRAYSANVLRAVPFAENSDDFIFDNEMLSQIIMAGFPIGELTCPTRYFAEASSIRLGPSIRYGLGVLRVSGEHLAHRTGIHRHPRYAGDTQA